MEINKKLINGKWEDIPGSAFSYHANLSLKSAKYNPLTKEVWLRLYGNNNGIMNGATIVTFSDIKYIPKNVLDVTNCGGGLWSAVQNTSSVPALIAFATIGTDGTVKVFYQANASIYFSGIEIRYFI